MKRKLNLIFAAVMLTATLVVTEYNGSVCMLKTSGGIAFANSLHGKAIDKMVLTEIETGLPQLRQPVSIAMIERGSRYDCELYDRLMPSANKVNTGCFGNEHLDTVIL